MRSVKFIIAAGRPLCFQAAFAETWRSRAPADVCAAPDPRISAAGISRDIASAIRR